MFSKHSSRDSLLVLKRLLTPDAVAVAMSVTVAVAMSVTVAVAMSVAVTVVMATMTPVTSMPAASTASTPPSMPARNLSKGLSIKLYIALQVMDCNVSHLYFSKYGL